MDDEKLLGHPSNVAGAGGQSVRITLGSLDPSGDGEEFEVICIQAGEANGVRFSEDVLCTAVPLFEGVTSFIDHGEWWGSGRSVRDTAGVISGVSWEPGRGVVGHLRLVAAESWLGDFLRQLVRDREKGLPVPRVGLSADVFLRRRENECIEITRVNSVDIVFDPAAGGSLERVLNSIGGRFPREVRTRMTEERVEYVVGAGGEGSSSADGEGQVQASVEAPPLAPPRRENRGEDGNGGSPRRNRGEDGNGGSPRRGRGDDSGLDDLRRVQCGAVLQTVLDANRDIPAPMLSMVEKRFRGSVFTGPELQGAVDEVRQTWADLQAGSVIQGMGAAQDNGPRPVVNGMWDSLDRLQMAFDRLMGLPIPSEHSDLPRLSGIRELYLMLSGDQEMVGMFRPERVRFANVTVSTVTSVVKNSLSKVLLKSYEMVPQWWKPIAYEEDFTTMHTVTWITLGGIANLDTVSEGDAYTEKSWSDNEETSTFSKQGNYVGITLEAIDRDDVGAIKQLPRKMGYAAAKTLSASVAALFTANSNTGPQLSDTYYLFDASNHSNLLTAALSASEWDTVIQAMFSQTEATSSRRLGIRPGYILVPIELEKTALVIVGSEGEPGTADNDLNPRRGSARVITVPEWTDANNWAAVADPQVLPGVCIGYRFGRVPEMFVADNNVVGSMFTNDEMRIKVRFIYSVGIGDYRAMHKSNVA